MHWWKERVATPGLISDLHDGESWKAEVADPVMNQEGEVQMFVSDCGDGADPCTGKHRGPQSVFFSAKRYLCAVNLSVQAIADDLPHVVHFYVTEILHFLP